MKQQHWNRKKVIKNIKFLLYVTMVILIHVFLFRYIYNIFGLELHAINMYIFLNYFYLLIKLYVLKYNPEDKKLNRVLQRKNGQYVDSMSDEQITNLRTSMIDQYKSIFVLFTTLDLQNLIFCIVLNKTVTSSASIIYLKMFFILNFICSAPIYQRMTQSYTLREMEYDLNDLFEEQ